MYLKALEIQGFKSFPDKTRLTFEKDITAVVGPNGSGKSNISDAILWVMGEQRTKTLRGGKMEDVIFGGTSIRPKMGFAQVSLIIDNTTHIFDADCSEVMITRRYYRSGESEYYINRESVRLRDISELLMDTGLGRDGYSIIGQGKISEVISSKSADRRELFEEAAGISRYRHRKDESERKLMRTDENLVRINDKIDELKISLDPLKEQAETAKKYLLLRDELRQAEVSLWMETLDRLQEREKTVTADWEQAKAALEQAQAELSALYETAENFTEKMRETDVDAENLRTVLGTREAHCAECESGLAVLENSLKHNAERQEQLKTELAEQDTRAKVLESQIAARHGRVDEIFRELSQLNASARALTEALGQNSRGGDGAKQQTAALLAEKTELQAACARSATMLAMLEDTAGELDSAEEKRAREQDEVRLRRDGLATALRAAEKACQEAREKTNGLKNVIEGYSLRLQGREAKVQALQEEQTKLTIAYNGVKSRAAMLAEMEKDFEGYSGAVKTVMRESGRGTLRGVWGPVANLVKTEDRYALAIETALGGAMQSLIIDTQGQGKSAIELLKKREAGRATFLPVDTIRGSELRNPPLQEEGYLGTAYELVSFDPRLAGIFSNLLSRTVVAESLSDAVTMSKRAGNQLRIVTLDGQLINAGGSMTGGSAAKNTGILSRANELKALRLKEQELQKQVEDCSAKLSEAGRELSSVRYALQTADFEQKEATALLHEQEAERAQAGFLLETAEKAIASFDEEMKLSALRREENKNRAAAARKEQEGQSAALAALEQQLKTLSQESEALENQAGALGEQIRELSEKRSYLTSESETTLGAIAQLEELSADLAGDGESRTRAIDVLTDERTAQEAQKAEAAERLSGLRAEAEEIKTQIKGINSMRLELEGKRVQTDRQIQEKNRSLLDTERLCGSLEQKKQAAEMEEKQIIDKLWDGYELSRTAASALRQPVENMAEEQRRIGVLKREIGKLGTPNIGAIEEYERISERYGFLSEQRDDVEKSKRELEKIIADITREMKEIFLREFRVINESFRETFLELFGGGRAELVLEDETDILGCGIEIKVQPPGKTLSTLSLLSGGEMAFVAIALYFAIIKVRPTPFCIMDEIEAALDEANVDRFARYLRKLTSHTQFIVITHRRGTMEEADMLYGVTMQEKGVTQVLSVDIEEAERTISN